MCVPAGRFVTSVCTHAHARAQLVISYLVFTVHCMQIRDNPPTPLLESPELLLLVTPSSIRSCGIGVIIVWLTCAQRPEDYVVPLFFVRRRSLSPATRKFSRNHRSSEGLVQARLPN